MNLHCDTSWLFEEQVLAAHRAVGIPIEPLQQTAQMEVGAVHPAATECPHLGILTGKRIQTHDTLEIELARVHHARHLLVRMQHIQIAPLLLITQRIRWLVAHDPCAIAVVASARCIARWLRAGDDRFGRHALGHHRRARPQRRCADQQRVALARASIDEDVDLVAVAAEAVVSVLAIQRRIVVGRLRARVRQPPLPLLPVPRLQTRTHLAHGCKHQ